MFRIITFITILVFPYHFSLAQSIGENDAPISSEVIKKDRSQINPVFLAAYEIGRICASHGVAFNVEELDHYRDNFLSRYMDEFEIDNAEWDKIFRELQQNISQTRLTRDDCFSTHTILVQGVTGYSFSQ